MDNKVLFKAIAIPLGASLLLGLSAKIEIVPVETKPSQEVSTPAEPATQKEKFNLVDVFFPLLPHQREQEQEMEQKLEQEVLQTPQTQVPETKPQTRYTRQELEALDNTPITYGPGTATGGNPAPYAPDAQKTYGKYGAHFIESGKNTIYLTFDCGYENFVDGQPLTGKILDTLKEKNIKALFFITQSYAEKNPELVRRILDEGHTLGNHAAGNDSMPALSIDEMEQQIMGLHEYVKEHFGYTMKFFRPPNGDFSLRSLAVTQNLGYETVHWSFAYADWDISNQPDPKEALDKILSCHHDGAIYLLHGVSATNAQILEDVIEGLWELGYHLYPLQ